jgi:hypothetical protein
MPVAEQLDSVTNERLRKQREFLLRNYWAELAKDPTSRATESSRSHLIAVQHTVQQVYGDAVAELISKWPILNGLAGRMSVSPGLVAESTLIELRAADLSVG